MKWLGAPEVSRHLLTLINLGVISAYSFGLASCVLQESTVSNPQTGNTIYQPQTDGRMETPMIIESVVIFCVMAGAILGMLHPLYKIYKLYSLGDF